MPQASSQPRTLRPPTPSQPAGAPPHTGREAATAWLAAVADANAARLSGGEMGALRSVGLGARGHGQDSKGGGLGGAWCKRRARGRALGPTRHPSPLLCLTACAVLLRWQRVRSHPRTPCLDLSHPRCPPPAQARLTASASTWWRCCCAWRARSCRARCRAAQSLRVGVEAGLPRSADRAGGARISSNTQQLNRARVTGTSVCDHRRPPAARRPADLFSRHLQPSWYAAQRRRRAAEAGGAPCPTLSGDRGVAEEDEGKGEGRPSLGMPCMPLHALECMHAWLQTPRHAVRPTPSVCRRTRCATPPALPLRRPSAAPAAGRRPRGGGWGEQLCRRRVLPDSAPHPLGPHARGAPVRGAGRAGAGGRGEGRAVVAPCAPAP